MTLRLLNIFLTFSLKKFQIFSSYLFNFSHLLSQVKVEAVFDDVLNRKINIKENILEKFFINVVKSNLDNFEKIEKYLLKCNPLLTQKILEKIITEYSNVNDSFSIFSILKLCRNFKLSVSFDSLNLPSTVYKQILNFVIDSTETIIDESFYTSLSNDNKSYAINNYKLVKFNENYIEKDDTSSKQEQNEEEYIVI